jgi:hypothetical protein
MFGNFTLEVCKLNTPRFEFNCTKMIPQFDLFHQLFFEDKEGFVAITDYTQDTPRTHVYTPQGEWCGGSGASNKLTLLADIHNIVQNRIEYEKRIFKQ